MEEERKISKHSGSVSIVIRLNSLWIDTHSHSRAGKFLKWNADLDRIWCELSRDLKEDEYNDKTDKEGNIIKGFKSLFEEFDDKLKETGKFKDNADESFDEVSKSDIESRDKQYKILMDKELFLRRLENHLGKGTQWEDEGDWEMD